MKELPELILEPERYELHAAPIYHFEVDRREFFRTLGCGLVVLFLVDQAVAQESGGGRRGGQGRQRPADIGAWLHIGEDGSVSVFTGKVEVGQNVRTSLTQAVAEELRVPVGTIYLTMADTQLTPYDAGTFGSRSTPDMGAQLRKISAAAREALLDLAAEHFKADRASLAAQAGKIVRLGGADSISFGELAKGKQLVKAASGVASTESPADWKIAGTSVPKVDGPAFVTGAHKYTTDIKRPGMLHGKVLRPNAFESRLTSIETDAAKAIPGVTVVRDGDFAGVVASNTRDAARAIEVLAAKWTAVPPSSDRDLFTDFKKNAKKSGGGRTTGSIETGLAQADHKIEQTYPVAYIAHAPLEPRAAIAEWEDGKLTVWTGTQRPFGVRGDLAQAFSIPEDRVRVITPDTGSGYGGKHTSEAALEAARLAKAAGKPVKLVWTREEEFTWAYFRPGGLIEISSGIRKDGTITAWEFHNYNSGGSGINTPYDIPNQKIEFHATNSPLRQGSYRGLAATANHFARETHMDELARKVGLDPLEFRLKNLKDSRLRAVLQAAAENFKWGKTKAAPDHGFGIAGGTEKGSYVAVCAEISIDGEKRDVKVVRVSAAFECGAIVNPGHLENQIEGAVVMGLGGALFEAIGFENGAIRNPRFSEYRVPRFRDAPRIEVVLVNRTDLPSAGAGETPIVGIAPAISNAVFDAVGLRLRSLPMAPQGLRV